MMAIKKPEVSKKDGKKKVISYNSESTIYINGTQSRKSLSPT